jgi:hypothetical protein
MGKLNSPSEHEVEPCLTPRLRLFLSVDLVGSTKLKQKGSFPIDLPQDGQELGEMGSDWFSPIAKFYREFESTFSRKWDHYEKTTAPACEWSSGQSPFLWKTNGDELLYVKEISEAHEVYACIKCWMDALKEYRLSLKESGSPLDVKATAWLAGFPITNHEIIFSKKVAGQSASLDVGRGAFFNHLYHLDQSYHDEVGKADLTIDFIGPSIDTGFRISQLATPRKFPVSIELALLLSKITPPTEMDGNIALFFEGKRELKGVMGGKPYPVFWIDTLSDDPLIKAEDFISNILPSGRDQIRAYCELFIRENDKFMFEPFVWNGKDPLFSQRPKNYDAKLKALNRTWLQEKQKFEIEKSSVSGESPPSEDGSIEENVSDAELETFERTLDSQK